MSSLVYQSQVMYAIGEEMKQRKLIPKKQEIKQTT